VEVVEFHSLDGAGSTTAAQWDAPAGHLSVSTRRGAHQFSTAACELPGGERASLLQERCAADGPGVWLWQKVSSATA
jgi:hypothetical protein